MTLYNIIKDGVVIKVTPRLNYAKWDTKTSHVQIVNKEQADGLLVDTSVYNVLGGPSGIPDADNVSVSAVEINNDSNNIHSDNSELWNNLESRLRSVEDLLMSNYKQLSHENELPWINIYTSRIMSGQLNLQDVPEDISLNVLKALKDRGFIDSNGGGD